MTDIICYHCNTVIRSAEQSAIANIDGEERWIHWRDGLGICVTNLRSGIAAQTARAEEVSAKVRGALDDIAHEIEDRHERAWIDGETRDALLVMLDEAKGMLGRYTTEPATPVISDINSLLAKTGAQVAGVSNPLGAQGDGGADDWREMDAIIAEMPPEKRARIEEARRRLRQRLIDRSATDG